MGERVPIGLRYAGFWETLNDGSEIYRGGRRRLISIPKQIQYDDLVSLAYNRCQINPEEFRINLKTSFTDPETGSTIYFDINDDDSVLAFMSSVVLTGARHLSPLYVTSEQIMPTDSRRSPIPIQAVQPSSPTNQRDNDIQHSQDYIIPVQSTNSRCDRADIHEEYVSCQNNEDPVSNFFQTQSWFETDCADIHSDSFNTQAGNYCDQMTYLRSDSYHEIGQSSGSMRYTEDTSCPLIDVPVTEVTYAPSYSGYDVGVNRGSSQYTEDMAGPSSSQHYENATDDPLNIGRVGRHNSGSMRDINDTSGPSIFRYLPPIPQCHYQLEEMSSTSSAETIYVGQIFNTKKELRDALGLLALKNHFQFRVVKSSTDRFEVKCLVDGCKWRIRATNIDGNDGYWSVRRFESDHTCHSDLLQLGHRQATSRFIGEYVMDKFQDPSRIYTPNNIRDDILREFGVRVSYRKAWLAREEARRLACGDPAESFNLLPQYCHVLTECNPGTVTHIQTGDNGSFLYFFMALGACLSGFRTAIRPVIAIDGTFLKGTYRGTMFVAAALDGNSQIYPVAFGVGDSENDASWEWFLFKLQAALGPVDDLVFVSDRHDSILKGIRTVFPTAYHGFCAYHIEGNLKAKYKLKDRKKDAFLKGFYAAAKSYIPNEFEKHMDKLRSIHLDAAMYLQNEIGFHRWARCYFPARRYDIMTTNIAESLNALLKDARSLPITALVEWIRSVLQRWFYERREAAMKNDDDALTEAANNKVREEDATSLTLSVSPVSEFEFAVTGRGELAVVDLNTRTCQCRRFNLQQLPCAHAMAAIRFVRGRFGEYCSKYYKNGTLLAAYAQEIHPVGDPKFWEMPSHAREQVVNPPIGRVLPGRRRNTRIPSAGEDVVIRRCSRCKQFGHNRATCRNPIQPSDY